MGTAALMRRGLALQPDDRRATIWCLDCHLLIFAVRAPIGTYSGVHYCSHGQIEWTLADHQLTTVSPPDHPWEPMDHPWSPLPVGIPT